MRAHTIRSLALSLTLPDLSFIASARKLESGGREQVLSAVVHCARREDIRRNILLQLGYQIHVQACRKDLFAGSKCTPPAPLLQRPGTLVLFLHTCLAQRTRRPNVRTLSYPFLVPSRLRPPTPSPCPRWVPYNLNRCPHLQVQPRVQAYPTAMRKENCCSSS